MSLADALNTLTPRATGPVCTVATILARLDKADAATLTAALADPTIPGSDLARAVTGLGHPVKGNTIQRHRRGDCTCEGGGA